MKNETRKKTFSFKRKGEDKDFDIIYSFLDSFPRGAAAFIVQAGIAYLKANVGQTVTVGNQKILIPDFSAEDQAFVIQDQKPKRQRKSVVDKKAKTESQDFISAPSATDISVPPEPEPEPKQNADAPDESGKLTFIAQDEETTDALCASFFNMFPQN